VLSGHSLHIPLKASCVFGNKHRQISSESNISSAFLNR
jgi:hypothetical protein